MSKRFYWFKMPCRFFKRHDMTILEGFQEQVTVPIGSMYSLIYTKLCCESVDHNGELRFSEKLPYTKEMLASVCRVDAEIMGKALDVFESLDLIQTKEDGTIVIPKMAEMIGSETPQADYMRRKRAEQSMLGQFQNVSLTKEEIQKLKEFYPTYWTKYVEKLSIHKESTGRKYDNDYATIMGWLLEDVGEMEA
ncbi:MAG: phage replisome organizer N-terminal domain-containing protein [Clostridiales bacterium]|nr:phage replisome organizer N-terminal domain-containing protein [Clostridiales bacterium]